MTEVANYDFARDADYDFQNGDYGLLSALEDVMGFIEAGKFGTLSPTRMWSAMQRIRIGIESAVLPEVLEMAKGHGMNVLVTPGEPEIHLVKDGKDETLKTEITASVLDAWTHLYERELKEN